LTGKSRLYFFLIILILLIPSGYLIFGNRHFSKKIGNTDKISSSPSTKPEPSKIPVNTTPLPSNTGSPHQKSQTSDIPPAFWDLFKQKEYDRAAGILEESLKEKPNSFEIMKFLADCYYLSGKTGKVYAAGEKLLAMQPGNPDVHILMGNIYLYRKKNGGEAIKYYRQALRLRPGDRSTALNLMEAYFLKKDIPSVISFLEKYLPDNPGDARAMIILGEAYIESGRLKDAQEIIKKALKIEPDDAVNWVLLAEAYMDNKEFDESMKALEMARSIDPNNKDVYLMGASPDSTIIDGMAKNSVIRLFGSTMEPFNQFDLTVNGFTLTNGNGTYGGGIYNYGGILFLINTKITDNHATNGGGLYNYGTASADSATVITDNTPDNLYGYPLTPLTSNDLSQDVLPSVG